MVSDFSFGSTYSSFLWSRIKVDLCPFIWLFLLLLWKPIHFPDLALLEKLVLGSTHLKCTNELFFFSFCESKILGSTYVLTTKERCLENKICFTIFMTLDILHKKRVTLEGSCCHSFFLKDPEFDPSLTNHVHSKIYGFFLHGNREFEKKSQHVLWFNIFIVFH